MPRCAGLCLSVDGHHSTLLAPGHSILDAGMAGAALRPRAITSGQNKRAWTDTSALADHVAQAHWLRLKSIFRYFSLLQCRQYTYPFTRPLGGSRMSRMLWQSGQMTHPSFETSLPCLKSFCKAFSSLS